MHIAGAEATNQMVRAQVTHSQTVSFGRGLPKLHPYGPNRLEPGQAGTFLHWGISLKPTWPLIHCSQLSPLHNGSGLKGVSARGDRSTSDYRFRGWSIPYAHLCSSVYTHTPNAFKPVKAVNTALTRKDYQTPVHCKARSRACAGLIFLTQYKTWQLTCQGILWDNY